MKDEISQSKPIVYNIGMPKSLNETLKFKVNCCWFLWQGNKKKPLLYEIQMKYRLATRNKREFMTAY